MAREQWPDWDVYVRDRARCVYCGLDGTKDIRVWRQLTVDHLIPGCQGGDDVYVNKVVACNRCNTLKGRQQLRTDHKRPRDDAHRGVLIEEARKLIELASAKQDGRADYELMCKECEPQART